MLSLADLRASDVAIQWHEAVAIVQELAATIGDGDVPGLEDIFLLPHGEVQTQPGGRAPDHPVKQLARTLQALIEGVSAPPELRLLVAESTFAAPRYATTQELARALAFFERPARRADIATLVRRVLDARRPAASQPPEHQPHGDERRADVPSRRNVRSLEELDRALSALPPQAARAEPDRANAPTPAPLPARRGRIRLIAATVSLLALAAVLGWMWTGEGRPWRADAQSLLASTPLPGWYLESREAVGRLWTTLGRTGQPGDEEGGDAEDHAGGGAPVPPTPASSSPRPRQSPVADRRGPEAAYLASTPVLSAASSAGPAPGPAPPVLPDARPPSSRPARSSSTEPVPSTWLSLRESPQAPIYTRDDADVVPAVLLHPKLPSEWPAGRDPDEAGVLEILVSETGDVEQVRLRSPTSRYQERMLLAAAKAWKFRPGLKDGEPVRYLVQIPITL